MRPKVMARPLRAVAEIPREADKTEDAIRLLVAAEEAGGGDALGEARGLLQTPCAQSAANALIAIGNVATNCDDEALGAVKAAERAVRDVVVLRLRSRADPADRKAFLKAAEEVFGRPGQRLDQEFQACLLLAFHKLRWA